MLWSDLWDGEDDMDEQRWDSTTCPNRECGGYGSKGLKVCSKGIDLGYLEVELSRELQECT